MELSDIYIDEYVLDEQSYSEIDVLVRGMYKYENLKLYAAFNEDEDILGYAVIADIPKNDIIDLIYVKVEEEYRRFNIGSLLIEYLEQYTVQSGKHSIRLVARYDRALNDDFAFFVRNGYALTGENVILEYKLENLSDNTLSNDTGEVIELIPYYNLENDALYDLLIDKRTSLDNFDVLYSRFCVDDEKLIGWIDVAELDENEYIIRSLYTDLNKKARAVVSTMIDNLIETIELLTTGEVRVYFACNSEDNKKFFVNIFGKYNATYKMVYATKNLITQP